MKPHVVKVPWFELFAAEAATLTNFIECSGKGDPDKSQATAVHPSQHMAMKDITD